MKRITIPKIELLTELGRRPHVLTSDIARRFNPEAFDNPGVSVDDKRKRESAVRNINQKLERLEKAELVERVWFQKEGRKQRRPGGEFANRLSEKGVDFLKNRGLDPDNRLEYKGGDKFNSLFHERSTSLTDSAFLKVLPGYDSWRYLTFEFKHENKKYIVEPDFSMTTGGRFYLVEFENKNNTEDLDKKIGKYKILLNAAYKHWASVLPQANSIRVLFIMPTHTKRDNLLKDKIAVEFKAPYSVFRATTRDAVLENPTGQVIYTAKEPTLPKSLIE